MNIHNTEKLCHNPQESRKDIKGGLQSILQTSQQILGYMMVERTPTNKAPKMVNVLRLN